MSMRRLASHSELIKLALSINPCTLLLSLSPTIFLSNTCCAGIFFFGIHTLVLFASCLFLFSSLKSTTLGDDENVITSLYNILVSVASVRKDGGVAGDDTSSSGSDSSSVSEWPDATSGGVGGGRRLIGGATAGVSASISRMRSSGRGMLPMGSVGIVIMSLHAYPACDPLDIDSYGRKTAGIIRERSRGSRT